jgi:hypothetical protein
VASRRDQGTTGYPFCRIRIRHGKTAARFHGTPGGSRPSEPVQLGYTTAPQGRLSPSRRRPAGGNTGYSHNIAQFNASTNALQGSGSGLAGLHRDRRRIKPRCRRSNHRRTLGCAAHCVPPPMATGHIQRTCLLREPTGHNNELGSRNGRRTPSMALPGGRRTRPGPQTCGSIQRQFPIG